jgi:hypothetical protein
MAGSRGTSRSDLLAGEEEGRPGRRWPWGGGRDGLVGWAMTALLLPAWEAAGW